MSRNVECIDKKTIAVKVTSREGRVSRNIPVRNIRDRVLVTSREGRVSRNAHISANHQ